MLMPRSTICGGTVTFPSRAPRLTPLPPLINLPSPGKWPSAVEFEQLPGEGSGVGAIHDAPTAERPSRVDPVLVHRLWAERGREPAGPERTPGGWKGGASPCTRG